MQKKNYRGVFISFEGIEGTGKTTQARLLADVLQTEGHEVLLTHEPGGTTIGTKIRGILLDPSHKNISPLTELLLYNAARAQHLHEKILPALNEGKIVITDRFSDSTLAYQGYGRGIDMVLIQSLDTIATGGIKPDLTILFDLDVEVGLKRNRGVNKIDRFELEDIAFHQKVREGFYMIAQSEPERVKVVDASSSIEQVQDQVRTFLKEFLWHLEK